MRHYLLSLGSNLGDREATLLAALEALGELPDAGLESTRLFETPPMYVDDQPPFLNLAARLHTSLEPLEMLDAALRIEQSFGRVRTQRYGPRTLDIDLIAADELVVDHPNLTLPHPRMHERRFVLEPLMLLASDWQHPLLGRTVEELLAALDAGGDAP